MARSWWRWGRQLDVKLQHNPSLWYSLGLTAQKAWRDYSDGWSAEKADELTKAYGHGMLRAGPEEGTFVGQQARGSVADRVRGALQ